jgi:hypothetical protein
MDRAVSDVLGYVLIFTLIVSSVAVVTVGGYDALDAVRDGERFDNAERVFDVLDEHVDAHLEDRVPGRATEVRLADASLDFGDPVTVNVSVPGVGFNRSTVDPLVYEQSGERRILYAAGATIRRDRGPPRLIDGPPFRFGNRTLITVVETRSRSGGLAGSARVLVRTEYVSQSVHTYTTLEGRSPTLNVTGARPEAWADWWEAETGEPCTVSGDHVTCSIDAESIVVRQVTIDVTIVD